METLYRKVEIKSEQDLPKVLHETEFWAHTKSDRMIKTNIAWTWRVNEIDWYLQPVEPQEPETKVKLLYKLINVYQSFTKWVLRHDKDIAESKRGKDHLQSLDEIEAEIRLSEAYPQEPIDSDNGYDSINVKFPAGKITHKGILKKNQQPGVSGETEKLLQEMIKKHCQLSSRTVINRAAKEITQWMRDKLTKG